MLDTANRNSSQALEWAAKRRMQQEKAKAIR